MAPDVLNPGASCPARPVARFQDRKARPSRSTPRTGPSSKERRAPRWGTCSVVPSAAGFSSSSRPRAPRPLHVALAARSSSATSCRRARTRSRCARIRRSDAWQAGGAGARVARRPIKDTARRTGMAPGTAVRRAQGMHPRAERRARPLVIRPITTSTKSHAKPELRSAAAACTQSTARSLQRVHAGGRPRGVSPPARHVRCAAPSAREGGRRACRFCSGFCSVSSLASSRSS